MARKASHRDVEFRILGPNGRELYFNTFEKAAAAALLEAMRSGVWKNFDVIIHSEEGARWWGGDNAVEQYRQDPNASVFERSRIKVDIEGTVP